MPPVRQLLPVTHLSSTEERLIFVSARLHGGNQRQPMVREGSCDSIALFPNHFFRGYPELQQLKP